MVDTAAIMQLMGNLPQILDIAQIIVYLILILFFGSIAVKGYRGYIGFPLKLLLRIGAGFVSLLGGLSLGGFIPFFNSPVLRMFQVDMLVSGIISSIILAVVLCLLSYGMRKNAIKRQIKSLEEKLNKIKGKQTPRTFKIIGVTIFIIFVVFILLNFRGFPSISEGIFSSLGIEDISDITGKISSLPAACAEIMGYITPSAIQNVIPYENQELKTKIETETGKTVVSLNKFESRGKTIVLGILENNKKCIATENELCMCID